jgi:tetratricopeptide (TPR) repeat protein
MRFVVASLVALLSAGPAVADEESWYPVGPDCVTSAASDDARRALAAYWFEQGTAQVDAAEFDAAVRSYGCSQRIIPHHSTLYNLARAAEWAGELEVALRALREYLETGPDVENHAEAEDIALRIAAALGLRDDPPPPPPDDPPPRPDDDGVGLQEAFGWAAVGLAGAAGAAGAVMGGLAAYEHGEIEDTADGTPWTEVAAREERRDTFVAAMGACLGVAGAAALAGVLLLVLDDDDQPAPVVVTPVAAPDAAGVVLTWSF